MSTKTEVIEAFKNDTEFKRRIKANEDTSLLDVYWNEEYFLIIMTSGAGSIKHTTFSFKSFDNYLLFKEK